MGVGWRVADICGQDNYVVKSTVFGLTALPGTNYEGVGTERHTVFVVDGRFPRKSVDSTALHAIIKYSSKLPA